MLKSESFSHLEKTLQKAQGLMAKVMEQNKQWPGGGAFEEDIVKSGSLLKESQLVLVDVFDTFVRDLCKSTDIDVQSANNRFDRAYHLLNLMHNDIKKTQLSLGKGESQTKAIENLEVHLKKFIKHCEETRDHILEAGKMQGAILTRTAKI